MESITIELSRIKVLCANLIRDPEFVKIGLEQNKPNIFRALKLQRNEIRHSNFLAYLLDPAETHGLGDQFLRSFVADVFEATNQGRDYFSAEEVDLRDVEIRREWRNFDLTITLPEDVIIIENKVYAQEGKGQLEKYVKIAKEEFEARKIHFVFLTRAGISPSDDLVATQYFSYSYSFVVQRMQELLDRLRGTHNPKIVSYLDDYVVMMKEDVLMDTKQNELAHRIYARHKEALDFIFDNKPDLAAKFYPFFAEAVKKCGFVLGSVNKGYVRFTTRALGEFDQRTGKGWPGKEEFLFEIDFFWGKPDAIRFKAVISPSQRNEAWMALCRGWPGFKQPQGAQWQIFSKVWHDTLSIDGLALSGDDSIRSAVETVVTKFCKVAREISTVMEATLEARDKAD